VTESRIGEQRFMIYNIGWEGYQGLLRIIGDGLPRLTYAHADVELMRPMLIHESYRARLCRVVWHVTEMLDIPIMSLGATTFHREDRDRGLEADESFYQANIGRIGRKNSINLTIDPPPDLAIEIELNRSNLNRLDVYAKLGFPEVWRFDGENLVVCQLKPDGQYVMTDSSLVFPFLSMSEVGRFVREDSFEDDTRWSRSFRAWVRDVLLPIYRTPA
jgi:Uma2 family endonuclease